MAYNLQLLLIVFEWRVANIGVWPKTESPLVRFDGFLWIFVVQWRLSLTAVVEVPTVLRQMYGSTNSRDHVTPATFRFSNSVQPFRRSRYSQRMRTHAFHRQASKSHRGKCKFRFICRSSEKCEAYVTTAESRTR